jgi:hypothetical protein
MGTSVDLIPRLDPLLVNDLLVDLLLPPLLGRVYLYEVGAQIDGLECLVLAQIERPERGLRQSQPIWRRTEGPELQPVRLA